jgi:hypothetical protein
VLILIIEAHEAPHLLVKFKLLATSVIPMSIANHAWKVQTTQVGRVCHPTFSALQPRQ